ncbi:cell wall-binding repeat-containing protein [Candidatus Poriferisodalis sp.]|uniref:cell wall-binding repeat-containing protein n=1 Tax=Candidatus Poriferisodalis sp. TaxID=3101277 RepID=UPI003B01BAB9
MTRVRLAAAAAAVALAIAALSAAFVVPVGAQEADALAARPAVQGPTRSPTAFRLGEVVYVLLHFDVDVTVQGSPRLPATIGSRTVSFKHQPYVFASRQALFSYRVAEGDFDSDGVSLSTGTLELSGGTFTPTSGGAATNRVTLRPFGPDHVNYLIDGVIPTLDEVRAVAASSVGIHRPGDVVEVELRWSEPVSVPQQHMSGTSVRVGILPAGGSASERSAALSAGNGTDIWRFRYTVRAEDGTGALGVLGSSLTLPAGANVRDAAGNLATPRWQPIETRLTLDAPVPSPCPGCDNLPRTPTGDGPTGVRGVTTTRVSGTDPTTTSVEVAEEHGRRVRAAGGDVDTVIVATSSRFPDGLAASSLAGKAQAPILLTDPDRLSEEVAGFIGRHAISRVYIMGGVEAVSLDVERSLAALEPVQTLTRLGGADRYETSVLIAREVGTPQAFCNRNKRTVLLATGAVFPDALAAAPVAAVGTHPLLLTEPDALPPKVRSYLRNGKHYDWIHNVLVIGGENAVSADVAQDIADMELRVVRVGGADRYHTAALLAEHAVSFASSPVNRCLGNRRVGVAVGTSFADALVAGPLLAYVRGPTLLVQPGSVPPSVVAFLEGSALNRDSLEVIAVGDPAVLADRLLERLRGHATGAPPTP